MDGTDANLVVRNGSFETSEFDRLTPERSIRSTVEPAPGAPVTERSEEPGATGARSLRSLAWISSRRIDLPDE